MVLNSLKKILLFSCVGNKKLIETMADDESTCTFRALRDLAAMQKGWRDSKESRYALTKCLSDLEEYMPE